MDYAAEQEMELEALEAILMETMEKYDGIAPDGWSTDGIYKVTLKPTDEDEQVERKLVLDLLFAYTETYPDAAPNLRLQSSTGLTKEEEKEIQGILEDEVQSNLGMAMMFNIFESVKEWLRNRANVDVTYVLTAEEKKKLEEEEEERKLAKQRAEGIPVTQETFQKWKDAFEKEIKAAAKKTKKVVDPRMQRLTGKQLFEQRQDVFEVADADGDEDFEYSKAKDDEDELDYDDDEGIDEVADNYPLDIESA